MAETEEYAKTARSTVNRYKQRAVYDHATVHSIIDAAPVAHVSFNPSPVDDDPFPTTLPMLACTGSFTKPGAEEKSAVGIYLHGHVASRLMRLPDTQKENQDLQGLPGAPVCVAATLFDGLVLALTPFNHSCNFRSAVVHGFANIVVDAEEKSYALKLLTDNLVPERWDNTRVPPTEVELKGTTVLRVDIASASAKVRGYTAGNDKADLANEEMRQRVWTGVVPATTIYGKPIAAAENLVSEVPAYMSNWIDEGNQSRKEYAELAAVRAGPSK